MYFSIIFIILSSYAVNFVPVEATLTTLSTRQKLSTLSSKPTTAPPLPPRTILNSNLNSFLKSRNGTKLPKQTQLNRVNLQSNFRQTSNTGLLINDVANLVIKFIQNQGNLSANVTQSLTLDPSNCPFNLTAIQCDSKSKYQSYDGSCNNYQNPSYGMSNLPYKRFLPPAYGDGFNSPRTLAISGKPLPNVRLVSLAISVPTQFQTLEKMVTHLFPIFGQFLAHDITGTSAITDNTGTEIVCNCSSSDPNCVLAVTWPLNDQYLNQSCMTFTRSSPTFPNTNCSLTYREQLNLLTPFIDGSQIYGMSSDIAASLRTFTGGMLNTSSGAVLSSNLTNKGVTNRTYLPLSTDTCSQSSNYKCFLAGEYRTSENLGLVSMQTLFNREHNRIAAQLAKLNPTWNDTALYFATRRIVIAQIQHVTYNEWLPIINGNYTLAPLPNITYFTGYDRTINPALTNEFATAGFRMGHSLIRQKLSRSSVFQGIYVNKSYNFQSTVFQSDLAYDQNYGGLNSILLGYVGDLAWKFGSFGFDLQNLLFSISASNGQIKSAVDLLATNINRGRDHGLQPYIYYVKKCLNISISSFTDLRVLMNGPSITALQKVYESVNDIDLYAGGLQEFVNSDLNIIGPTFSCLIMNQFSDLKKGDRFYYENSPTVNSAAAFTLPQLATIKNVTMAGLICNNYDISTIPRNAFYNNLAAQNPVLNCSQLFNQLDLTKWIGSF